MYETVANLGEGPGGPASLFWVKKKEMTEGKKASRANKSRSPPPPLLSSRSGSATVKDRTVQKDMKTWLIISVVHTSVNSCEINWSLNWKNRPARDSNSWSLLYTDYRGAALYQLSYQVNLEVVRLGVRNTPVEDEECMHRGYYTVSRRYEFYVRVARAVSRHENINFMSSS